MLVEKARAMFHVKLFVVFSCKFCYNTYRKRVPPKGGQPRDYEMEKSTNCRETSGGFFHLYTNG